MTTQHFIHTHRPLHWKHLLNCFTVQTPYMAITWQTISARQTAQTEHRNEKERWFKVTSVQVAWFLEPDRLVWVLHNVLISRDLPAQAGKCLGFTENGPKIMLSGRKFFVNVRSQRRKAMLLWGDRKTTNDLSLQSRCAEEQLLMHNSLWRRFLQGRYVNEVNKILVAFRLPPNFILSWSQ